MSKKNIKAVILHGEVPAGAPADEQDVLTEARAVAEALTNLGYEPVTLPLSFEMGATAARLKEINPLFVFNLVESIEGQDRFVATAALLLEMLGLPYTGNRADTLYLSSNKLLAKRIFSHCRIDTPRWQELEDVFSANAEINLPFILKRVWEHASIGMDAGSVFASHLELLEKRDSRMNDHVNDFFIEEFVNGREFNVPILGPAAEPSVLNPSEILFEGFPEGKPKIVDYKAKWDKESFEYRHTTRKTCFEQADEPLLTRLKEISIHTWNIFGLRGYARIDFRVDSSGRPWVLEVNANPCLSPDSGFVASASEAGLAFDEMVKRIVNDAIGN